ncbi:MAG TPA: FAD-dependent oxidoreductase [Methanomicrobiales archaeon]|nr:FAD-dependent oxidoreductase [Methanomicrobiales archaeon]
MYTDSAISAWDAVVIGGGLTGLRAALRLSRAGLAVAVISKVHPLRSHSVAAQGGMNAALGNVPGEDGTADSWENHAFDTVKGSDYLADQDAVALMCREAPATVVELEHMGTVWSRLPDGRIAQRPFGGAGFPRTCYAEDRTGHNVLHTLYQQVLGQGIPVFEEHFVTSLVTDAGRCTGCTALEIMTGAVRGFAARAVLLATGGFGRVFSRSTNALINTGDGMALALRAGAPLKDMEFVQFHPTSLHGTNILISEAARGEGGFLLNRHGERFMERYAPRALELAPRDVVARAIAEEIERGNGFGGGYVHLDLRHLGPAIIGERLPGIRQIALDFAGVDPVEQPIPVQPGQHYSMGGVDVDIAGRSGLPGLYAAGECACVSVHGANRLGGNSLLETVVFGRLVAGSMESDLKDLPEPRREPIESAVRATGELIREILGRTGGEPGGRKPEGETTGRSPGVDSPFPLIREVQETMFGHFGIFREGPPMEEGLRRIRGIRERASLASPGNREAAVNQALVRYLELEMMLLLAETVARGAIAREESRGSHFRRDFPKRDDERFLSHTIAGMREGEVSIGYKPVTLGMFGVEERGY